MRTETFEYMGVEFVENQEPTDKQIRELMKVLNVSYYEALETARELVYGPPPRGYDSWIDYQLNKK